MKIEKLTSILDPMILCSIVAHKRLSDGWDGNILAACWARDWSV